MDEKLVVAARFGDYIKAEMAKQLLADNGIEALVLGDNASNVFGGISAIGEVELQCGEGDAARAKEILDASGEQE